MKDDQHHHVFGATLPAPDVPRAKLTPRVFDQSKMPDPKMLRKALASGDPAEKGRVWPMFTREVQLEVLAEHLREQDLVKSNAMPADANRAVPAGDSPMGATRPKVNWATGYKVQWSRWHPAPAQQAQQAPAQATVVAIGTGPVRKTYRPARGNVLHFPDSDGTILHGRILDFGNASALIVTPDAGEYQVDWSEISEGVHPDQRASYEASVQKSQAAERDRAFRDTIEMLTLEPEARAEWWRRRHGEDPLP